jgi:hypothetical protein
VRQGPGSFSYGEDVTRIECRYRVIECNLTPIRRHTAPIALKSLGKHSVALPLGEIGNVGPKWGDETPQTRQK